MSTALASGVPAASNPASPPDQPAETPTGIAAGAQRSLFRRSFGTLLIMLCLTWLGLVARELIDIGVLQARNGQAENVLWAGLAMDRARDTHADPVALKRALERLEALRAQEWRQKGHRPPFRLLQIWRGDTLVLQMAPDLRTRDRHLPQESEPGQDARWLYTELSAELSQDAGLAMGNNTASQPSRLLVRSWQERPGDWHFSLAGLSFYARPLLYAVPLLLLPLWLLFRLGFGPLQRMGALISQRADNDLTPLPATRYKELAPLVSAINSLMKRLQQRLDREHEFLVDAAHELKTPLAVVQLCAEGLDQGTPEAREETRERLRSGVQRATHTVHQLLALARSGADTLELPKARHDLVDLLRERIALAGGLAARHHIELELLSPEQFYVELNLESMSRLIDNLVDNAIKYSPPGGKVSVELLLLPTGGVRLSVSDEGPGIPVDQRQRVFERFVRLHPDQIHGSGLGLTIVERAAAQHGAHVTLQDGPSDQGLTVSLELVERG